MNAFDSTLPNFYKPLPNAKHVGETRFTNDQLEALGEALIREFGSYHRVFWNCQTFAKCYLRVITGDTQSDFVNWTAVDTSRLIYFCVLFSLGAPFATTKKVRESARAQDLIKRF